MNSADGVTPPPVSRRRRRGVSHYDRDELQRFGGYGSGSCRTDSSAVRRLGRREKPSYSQQRYSNSENAPAIHKQLEEQLRQVQKMAAVGQLAGGIAHDFNNLLTIILGQGSLLSQQTQPGDSLHEGIRIIRATAERAAALTRQLLAFSRKQPPMPAVFNLNTVVSEWLPMLRRLLGEDICLEADLADDLGPVEADRHQLEQVLVNLVVNARDAMPAGGLLILSTREEEANVVLTVRDTGQGMDEYTRAHLFEPFFTTKEAGKGTGLGLAMVYGIVQQSGGRITVDSAPGEGATFRIELPCVASASPRAVAMLEAV